MLSIASVVGGKSSLHVLHAQGQSSHLDEGHIADVYTKLANSLGELIKLCF